MTTPALRVTDLEFGYAPSSRVLDSVSLEIADGSGLALLGPNGSGKSTLLKVICGTLPADGGAVEIFGRRAGAAARVDLGVVFQRPALDPHLTVEENLRIEAGLYGLDAASARAAIERELERAELGARRRWLVKKLSGGLARRVDLLRAVLHGPRLLLLDEPTVGLDPSARRSFLDDLDARRERDGLAIVLSTHLTDEADRFERAILLDHGRIVADGPPAQLRRQVGARTITVRDPSWDPPDDEAERWQRTGGGWRRHVDDGAPARDGASAPEAMAARLARDGVPFSVAPPTLDDLFEQLTGTRIESESST